MFLSISPLEGLSLSKRITPPKFNSFIALTILESSFASIPRKPTINIWPILFFKSSS